MEKKYGLYDVCKCKHEYLQHDKKCSAIVPIGKEGYRGFVEPGIPSKTCSCKGFKYSLKNSGDIVPSER
jgi:hypothetical protein